MSRLYNFLQTQINALLQMTIVDQNGNLDFSKLPGELVGPGNFTLVISILTTLLYLGVVAVAGMYLWNHGLSAMAPSVLKPFGMGTYTQSPNPFFQMFITLLALTVFF
jgi:hypothetical protein